MKPRIFGGMLAGLALLVLLAGGAAFYGFKRFERSGPLVQDTQVVIQRGAVLESIARRLEAAGVVEDARSFRWGVRLLGSARGLKAGEYAFPAGVSMRGAYEILDRGETVARWLTVAEGLSSYEIVDLVAGVEGLSGETGPVPLEGSLLPETYQYSLNDDRAALIERMQTGLEVVLAELWPKRAEGLPIKTLEEAVILASIVEKETGVPEERPLVASVFTNRLKRRMRLQSDPTVVYSITEGKGPLGRRLLLKDLKRPSPYNTYENSGLPPAPIANPGRAALEAVLNPADTRYLYFVADGTGGHAFAKTLVEHNKNVAKWRKIRRRMMREQKRQSQQSGG